MYFLDILWCVVWLLWLFQPRNHLLCNLLLMSRLFYSFIQLIYTFDIFLSSRPNENDLEAPFFFVFKFNFKNSIRSSVRVLATTLEMLSKACLDVLKNKEAFLDHLCTLYWTIFEIFSKSWADLWNSSLFRYVGFTFCWISSHSLTSNKW